MKQNKIGIRHLAEICAAKGIENIIISPGSRNAPIILAFKQQSGIHCLSIVDERSAGFFALGMAQQTRKTVAIACTSGTAVLNYAPAIAEAFYQKVPLLIITADRPVEWIDMADSQTIRQKDIFKNYIQKSVELPQTINTEDELWHTDRLINEAINSCVYPVSGPVHINLPFTEPLYEGYDDDIPEAKIIDTLIPENLIGEGKLNKLADQWNTSKRKLMLSGMLQKEAELNSILKEIEKDPSVVLLSETTSNLYSENFHPCIDRLLSSISKEESDVFKPDLLITFGNQIISKKVKAFLRNHRPENHWHIDPTDLNLDTYQSLTQNIPMKPIDFFKQLRNNLKDGEGDYANIWEEKEGLTQDKHTKYLNKCVYSDLQVFDILLKNIPQNSDLQLANSTVVRYAQLFRNREDLNYFSNRGTSGIDGCISTAVGAAHASQQPTTLITGDLSFFYDSNGLWNNYLSKKLRIIIINNGGGGIFRFIDGPASSNSLEYFETPHTLNAEHIAKTFGVDYFSAHSIEELEENINPFYAIKVEKTAILEIFTPREKNAEILKDYFRYLKTSS